jgi:hypothetical protein
MCALAKIFNIKMYTKMFDAYAKERGKLLDANKTTRVKLLGKYFRDVRARRLLHQFYHILYYTYLSHAHSEALNERHQHDLQRTIFYCYLISTRETNTIKKFTIYFLCCKNSFLQMFKLYIDRVGRACLILQI